jgi:peptidyl-prolyl cis-trans isomerase SurA
VALSLAANDVQLPPEELERLRLQVFRNLIDETLQIQEAKANEIVVSAAEIDQFQNRVAANFNKKSPAEFDAYLRGLGSSTKSIRRQIEGELAWRKLQSRKIEAFVNVGDEEVQAIIDKLNASKGTQEYRIAEIFLAATPETQGEAMANAERIIQQIRNGGSFLAYARQFSQASLPRSAEISAGFVPNSFPTRYRPLPARCPPGRSARRSPWTAACRSSPCRTAVRC